MVHFGRRLSISLNPRFWVGVRWHDVAPAPLVLGAEPAWHSVVVFFHAEKAMNC